jgi:uncharacterized protein YegL
MPKLASGTQSQTIPGSNYSYQATRIGELGATEYTLVTVVVDTTSSVYPFANELREMLITAVQACQRSPRSNNLMLRAVEFNSAVGVREIHGFKPLSEIDTSAYQAFQPAGATPLFDATFNALGAMFDYGKQLADNDFLANGIVFIVTDGDDNHSTMTPSMIRRQIEEARREERLESVLSILVGINAAYLQAELDQFKREAGLDQYIDAGQATPSKLAKLATFVSQSVSSQSQALGTGGPSQAISATI